MHNTCHRKHEIINFFDNLFKVVFYSDFEVNQR